MKLASRLALATATLACLAAVCAGGSWGAGGSGYNPLADSNSMLSTTLYTGAQSWWRAGYTGRGVDIAVIDSGVSPVPGLDRRNKVVHGPDLSLESQAPNLTRLDTFGHGTFMSGLIAGHGDGYYGMAPGARIISLKVATADGGVDVSQVIAAIDWVVQHADDPGLNIRVLNLSYGTNSRQSYLVDPLAYAAEQAWKKGIVVVAAAGNSGYQRAGGAQGLADPAYDPYVLAVGASDSMGTIDPRDDQVGAYSAGTLAAPAARHPDVVAPGSHIQGLRVPNSFLDARHPEGRLGERYFRGTGTSQAAAIVSGAVALVLQRYPSLSPDLVKRYFEYHARPLRGFGGNVQGAGLIQLGSMLRKRPQLRTVQRFPGATGLGSLELARGDDHLTRDGVVLTGEQDIFGKPWDAAAMTAAQAAGSSWSGGMWNGSSWSGSSWSGSSWSGSSWSGSSWSGSSWSGALVGQLLVRQLVERELLVRKLLVREFVVGELVVGKLLVGLVELTRVRFDGPIRVGALGLLVGGLATAIYAVALAGQGAPADVQVPWWTLMLVFLVAEASVVHLHFRSEAHSLSLSEAGLVFGLFFASPLGLIAAQLAGGSLALLALRRQRPLKVAFNLAQFALSSCIALVIFRALTDLGGFGGPASWLAAFAAAGAASLTGLGLVGVAIALAEGKKTLRELPTMLGIALGGGLATAGLAIAAAELLQANAWAVTLLLVPAFACALALRGYAGQRRRNAHVEFLYRSMRTMQSAPELRTAVRELLAAARTMLAAEFAEIVLLPSGAGEPALRSTISPSGERLLQRTELSEREAVAVDLASSAADAILLPRGRQRHELDAYLTERGLPDAILTVLRAEDRVVGALLVGQRAGDVSTFNADDRKLFETFASHAAVLLENDRVKEQLRYQAFHDALTGLPNRLLFAEQVRAAIEGDRDEETPAVLFLDLDDFKTINDSLGHGAGDGLLVAVAERLRGHVRPGDLVARLGGDEFAVLLERTPIEAAERAAGRLVQALRAPFVLHGHELSIHASIGIAGHYGASTADELLRNADVAMYSAKDNGKRGYALYEPEMHARVRRRQELIASVERAVERSEITVHYQPIVSLADGETVAVEALARWQHPQRGLVPPGSFIPIAEETGLMIPIGRTVLRQACDAIAAWRRSARTPLSIAVNLSPSELQNPSVADEVEAILTTTRIPAHALTLEITESGAMRDPEGTIEKLHLLRRLGVRLALDDFGTGYSSLSHLREFPIDILKIAKPFVDDLGAETSDTAFLEAILALARALDLTVVVEGIETAEQAAALNALGCELGQGYHFARPLDRAAASEHLKARPLAAA